MIIVGGKKFTKNELDLINKNILGRYERLKNLSIERLNIIYNLEFCFSCPSKYEEFGISPLEVMKSRCSVITTNLSSISEVVVEVAIKIDCIISKKN